MYPGHAGSGILPLRVTAAYTERLEAACDAHNEALPKLNSFILPGGTPGAALLHQARVVVRRAERSVWALLTADAERNNPRPPTNRLSTCCSSWRGAPTRAATSRGSPARTAGRTRRSRCAAGRLIGDLQPPGGADSITTRGNRAIVDGSMARSRGPSEVAQVRTTTSGWQGQVVAAGGAAGLDAQFGAAEPLLRAHGQRQPPIPEQHVPAVPGDAHDPAASRRAAARR